MACDKTWGTDIEILTASSLLNTDIYVYTKTEKAFCWHRFSKQMLHRDKSLPVDDGSIYLYHENWVHYDVVLDVKDVTSAKRKVDNNLDLNQSTCKKLKREKVFSDSGIAKSINIDNRKFKETNCRNTFGTKKQVCFEVNEKDAIMLLI